MKTKTHAAVRHPRKASVWQFFQRPSTVIPSRTFPSCSSPYNALASDTATFEHELQSVSEAQEGGFRVPGAGSTCLEGCMEVCWVGRDARRPTGLQQLTVLGRERCLLGHLGGRLGQPCRQWWVRLRPGVDLPDPRTFSRQGSSAELFSASIEDRWVC